MFNVLQTVLQDSLLALDQHRLPTLSLTHLEIKQPAGLLSMLYQVGQAVYSFVWKVVSQFTSEYQ